MFSPSPGILTSRHLHNTKALVEDVDPTRDLPTEPGETTVTECFVFAKPAQQHQNQSWTNSNIISIQTTQEITISSMTWNQICTYVKSLWITSTKHMHRPVNVAPTCEIQYHVHQLGLLSGPVFWYPLRTSEQKFVFRHLHHPRTGKLKRWFWGGGRPGKHLPAQQKLAQNHEATRKTTRTIFAIITTNPTSSSS